MKIETVCEMCGVDLTAEMKRAIVFGSWLTPLFLEGLENGVYCRNCFRTFKPDKKVLVLRKTLRIWYPLGKRTG